MKNGSFEIKGWFPIVVILPESAYYTSKSRPDYKDIAATLKLNGYTKSTSEVDEVAKFVK